MSSKLSRKSPERFEQLSKIVHSFGLVLSATWDPLSSIPLRKLKTHLRHPKKICRSFYVYEHTNLLKSITLGAFLCYLRGVQNSRTSPKHFFFLYGPHPFHFSSMAKVDVYIKIFVPSLSLCGCEFTVLEIFLVEGKVPKQKT